MLQMGNAVLQCVVVLSGNLTPALQFGHALPEVLYPIGERLDGLSYGFQ
jgi:hypothetical protein